MHVERDLEIKGEWDLFDGVNRLGRVQSRRRGMVHVWLRGEDAPLQRRFRTVAEVLSYFRRQPELIIGQVDEDELPGVPATVAAQPPEPNTPKKAPAAKPTVCGSCFQVPAANGACGCE